jgi:hypothetical protein
MLFTARLGSGHVFELGGSNRKSDGYKSRDQIVQEQWEYLVGQGFDESMIEQLHGRDCEYKESHTSVHSMQVNIVAACLSEFLRETDDKTQIHNCRCQSLRIERTEKLSENLTTVDP